METRHLVLLMIAPFALIFIYAIWHEYVRFKRDGASSYGLTYDATTNTTHVGALPEDDDGYDPEEFDPEDEVIRTTITKVKAKAARAAVKAEDDDEDDD